MNTITVLPMSSHPGVAIRYRRPEKRIDERVTLTTGSGFCIGADDILIVERGAGAAWVLVAAGAVQCLFRGKTTQHREGEFIAAYAGAQITQVDTE